MRMAVYKYPLPIDDDATVEMPVGAEILTVQAQNGVPCLWAAVDPDAPTVKRRFRMAGTGHPIEAVGAEALRHGYIGTCQFHGGSFVLHVFEKTEPTATAELDNNRCALCGWPLVDDVRKGCVRGNCAQRPLPERPYDYERAMLEAMSQSAREFIRKHYARAER